MKSDSLRKEVLSLHPILRLSLSAIIHIDKDLIIADASRFFDDYNKMGLKSMRHSLHYKQYTGYAHAVDLRVKG